MSSKVQLCNLALTRLGAKRITAIDENTREGSLCNILFDDIADQVIAEGLWPSTIKRASLAQTTNTPVYEYSYEYQLPVNPLAIRIIDINESIPGSVKYSIEGDKLLTDESSVKIKYVARITDTQSWDIYLKEAFVARLASELAFSLTANARLAESETVRYQKILTRNLTMAARNGSPEFFSSSVLLDVR